MEMLERAYNERISWRSIRADPKISIQTFQQGSRHNGELFPSTCDFDQRGSKGKDEAFRMDHPEAKIYIW
jgi:hypothetical protein